MPDEPMSAARPFPILRASNLRGLPTNVPWAFVAPHERQADINHGQTLKRLAERGGLSWCELLAVVEDRPWRLMATMDCHRIIVGMISALPVKPEGE